MSIQKIGTYERLEEKFSLDTTNAKTIHSWQDKIDIIYNKEINKDKNGEGRDFIKTREEVNFNYYDVPSNIKFSRWYEKITLQFGGEQPEVFRGGFSGQAPITNQEMIGLLKLLPVYVQELIPGCK